MAYTNLIPTKFLPAQFLHSLPVLQIRTYPLLFGRILIRILSSTLKGVGYFLIKGIVQPDWGGGGVYIGMDRWTVRNAYKSPMFSGQFYKTLTFKHFSAFRVKKGPSFLSGHTLTTS
jgi:hypothetical protein